MEQINYYKSSCEYVLEQLKLLDLKIHKYITLNNLQEKSLNPFKGLVINEKEISTMLRENEISKDVAIKIDKNIRELSIKINEKLLQTRDKNIFLNYENICESFELSYIERNLLLIGLCVEIDQKYEKIFAFIQDNINKKRPTIEIGLKLLNLNNLQKIEFMNKTKKDSLFKLFILDNNTFDQEETFLSSQLIVDDRIINYILENDAIDEEIKDYCMIHKSNRPIIEVNHKEGNIETIHKAITNYIEDDSNSSNNLYIYLWGQSGVGKKHLIKSYCKRIKKDLIIGDIKMALKKDISLKEFVKRVFREAVLRQAILVFENYHILESVENKEVALRDFFSLMELYIEPIFLISEQSYKQNKYLSENSVVLMEIKRPDKEKRKDLWNVYTKEYGLEEINKEDVSTKFNFTPKQIRDAVISIKSKALTKSVDVGIIYDCCYEQVDNKLTDKAVKVKTTYEWKQLILPSEQKKLLKDACNQVKNKYKVYEKWGFGKKVAYGRGLSIICAGPPGTGKTMSAQVMARELNLELYRIDLSQMVSKYVGETEKNLHIIFEEASLSNAILFFDEGDALFGKRSEVKSSNDRYSNIQTSYLLQKMEEYEGITMLTTNFLKNIDKAFLRRINFIVNFPFPDNKSRKDIWKIMMSEKAPIDEDIDYDFLANTFEVAGGNIKNIIVYAAFLAASENENISMKHIIHAAKYELQKMDKLLLKEDLGEYRYLLELS